MTSALDKVHRCLESIPFLHSRGPVSYEYGQWVDATHLTLVTLFGTDSSQAQGFLAIVGEGAEARGWGLPLAPSHPWGMHARLGRAEAYLKELVQRLEGGN